MKTLSVITADISRNGWLTVQRIRNRGSLSTTLLKKIEKEDENIDKTKKNWNTNGRFGERSREVDRQTEYPHQQTSQPEEDTGRVIVRSG